MIRRIHRSLPWFGVVAALLLLAPPAQADGVESESYVEGEAGLETEAEPGPNTVNAVLDFMFVRPLYFSRWVLGLPLFVFYPLTIASGWNEDVVAQLWTEPFDATFRRPLGEPVEEY